MKRTGRSTPSGLHRPWSAAAAICAVVLTVTGVGAHQLSAATPARPLAAPGAVPPAPSRQAPRFRLPAMKWTLSWSDEFNGRGGPTKWTLLKGGGGWSHQALQYYDPAQAKTDGHGNLVISATRAKQPGGPTCWYGPCTYSSARLQTKGTFSQAYGRFTARIKLPQGTGIWPAFWLQRVDAGLVGKATYGEIDVIETIGNETDVVRGYAHALKHKGGGIGRLPQPADTADYHVYGVDWTPESVTWWVDGTPYAQFMKYSGWPFTKPFFMILNLQVGGQWPGPPDATTRFPAHMTVDWVRVYRMPR